MHTFAGSSLLTLSFCCLVQNGRYTNVKASTERGKPYELRTIRPVKAGEELVSSYSQCPFCDPVHSNPQDDEAFLVTPQLFELYGFVEPIPQRWVVPGVRLLFDVKYANDQEPDDNELRVDFVVPPCWQAVHFLKKRVAFLREFENELKDRTDIPQVELDGLRSFHNALLKAFSLALDASAGQTSEQVWSLGKNDWYRENEIDHSEL